MKMDSLALFHPSSFPSRSGTFVYSKCLLRREESATLITNPFAHFPMLRDFVSQSVVLSRKLFRAAEGTWQLGTRFLFMSFHVQSERVGARELRATIRNQTAEATSRAAFVITRGSVFSRRIRTWERIWEWQWRCGHISRRHIRYLLWERRTG